MRIASSPTCPIPHPHVRVMTMHFKHAIDALTFCLAEIDPRYPRRQRGGISKRRIEMKIASTVYLALATVVAGSALSASASYAQSYPDTAQNCTTASGDSCTYKDTTRRGNDARTGHVHSTEHGDRAK